MLYLVGYSITNLVVFAGLIAFFNMTGKEMVADFAGLAGRQPFMAAAIAMGLFSLSGLPIFAGFAIKFYLFTAVANEGFLWLAGLAIFTSLISLYYYLQVIRQMYIESAPEPVAEEASQGLTGQAGRPPALLLAGVAIGVVAMVWIGVYPAPLLDPIEAASRAILPGT
jgi:NADH-quinone oxidoreductase subunit N